MQEINKNAKILYDFHCLNQPLRKADCLFLLGSHDPSVADYTAKLFHEKWADWIIVSGGVMRKVGELRITDFDKLEAHALAKILVEKGVPKDKILIEDKATNTGENFIYTKQLLHDKNLPFQSFILVQKPYMLRRTFATAGIQFADFDYVTSSEPDTYEQYIERCRQNNVSFFKVLSNMTGDLQRLKIYPEKGFMIPTEIPAQVWQAYEALIAAGYDGRMAK